MRSSFSSCKSSAFERLLGLSLVVFSSLTRALHRGRDVTYAIKERYPTHCTGSLRIRALHWASEHLFTFFLILISRKAAVCGPDSDGVRLHFRHCFPQVFGCRWLGCLLDGDCIVCCCTRCLGFVGRRRSRTVTWSLLSGLGNAVALGLRSFLSWPRLGSLGRGVI